LNVFVNATTVEQIPEKNLLLIFAMRGREIEIEIEIKIKIKIEIWWIQTSMKSENDCIIR
jgi:hypothetical protein